MKKKLPIILMLLFLGMFIVACASPAEDTTDSGEETTTEETTTTEEEPMDEEEAAPEEEPMDEEAMDAGSIAVLLPDSASSDRWEADDRRFLEAAFDAAGVEYSIVNAEGDARTQQTQAEQAITNGAKVILMVNLDSGSGAAIIAQAREAGVKVIDYDRLTIEGDGADYYVSFDNEAVGRLQGEGIVKAIEEAGLVNPNVAVLNGSPTDNNATLFANGYNSVITPYFESGDWTLVDDQSVPDWDNQQALVIFEQMLTAAGGEIDAAVAANDGLGGAVSSALKNQGLDQIPVTGQDATAAGIQRVLAGEQSMTVYKAIKAEAEAAAALAVALLNGEDPGDLVTGAVNNGTNDIPSVLLVPVSVTKDNIEETVIADGFRTWDEICVGDYAAYCEEGGEEAMEEDMGDMRTDNLEGETIKFYHFGDLSGPLAGITGPLIHGFEDAISTINENGGIRGAEVEIEFTDTQSSVDEAVAAYDRYTSEDDNVLVMFTYGSGDGEALASRFVEDQIPNLAAGLSSVAFYGPESGYTFGYGPIYPDQFGLFLDWLSANWADQKPASAGDEINLAYISWPTAYGQAALTEESRAYAESLGVNIVAEEIFDVSPTADATTAILNAQAAGANVIYTNSLAFGPAAILNGLGALGLRDEFFVGGNNWATDLATYAFVTDPALAVGFTSPFISEWWTDTDVAGIETAHAIFAANERPASEQNVGYLLTLAGVDIAVKAIEDAIDRVGFDNLTGEEVYNSLVMMGEYQPFDGVMRVNFNESDRSPHQAQIRQIQGGPDAFVVLQDWTDTPDLRPADNFSNE